MARPAPKRSARLAAKPAAMCAAILLMVAACGDGEAELTIEQQLDKLTGRTLTEDEREEWLELADLMCGFDDRMLRQIWDRLDARQLEFQDWVFGTHCPERITVYGDIRTSLGTTPPTTAPPSTTTPPRPTTTLDETPLTDKILREMRMAEAEGLAPDLLEQITEDEPTGAVTPEERPPARG